MYKKHYLSTKLSYILSFWAVALLFSPLIKAQNNSTESPYTRFGIGSLSQSASNTSRSLGNTGIALSSKGHINPKNPASYIAVDSQTFIMDFSSSIGFSWFAENNKSDSRLLGNFEYLSMLFPVTKWMAVSAGVMPYSSVGYRFGSTQPIGTNAKQKYSVDYSGNGTINEFYLGTAFAPFKGFSIGVNASFLLGELKHIQTVSYNTSSSYNTLFFDALRLSGFKGSVGMQYTMPIAKSDKLTLGITYTPSLPLKSVAIHQESVLQSGVPKNIISSDSVSSNSDYKVPMQLGAGVAYEVNQKLLFTADLQYNFWQGAILEKETYKVQNQWQAGMGIAYTPDASDRSFWKKIEYRGGFSAENSYLQLSTGKSLSGYYKGGISLGVGIPMVDRRSFLDLTLDYGHLMPLTKEWVHENYIRFTVGLRFNEGWFRKIKLD